LFAGYRVRKEKVYLLSAGHIRQIYFPEQGVWQKSGKVVGARGEAVDMDFFLFQQRLDGAVHFSGHVLVTLVLDTFRF